MSPANPSVEVENRAAGKGVDLHLTARLEHLRIATLVLIGGPGLMGAALLALAFAVGLGEFLVPGALALTTCWILWLVRRRLAQHTRQGTETAAAAIPGRFAALVLTLCGCGVVAAWQLSYEQFKAPLDLGVGPIAWLNTTGVVVISISVALALLLLARFYGTTRTEVLAEARGLASWLRVTAWLTLLETAAYMHGDSLTWLAPALSKFEAFLVLELLAEGLLIALLARRTGRLALACPLFLRIFFGRLDPVSSFFAFLTEAFGIDLRGSWALAFIRRSLAPTLLALAVLAWVGSAFTLVGPSEVGVVEVFGARSGRAPVSPGLHLGWPWPIESVQRVAVDRVRSLPIGFARAKSGASMLWTAQHAEEEYKLLLGDGHELISVNAVLQFKVSDPLVYLYSCADPEGALAAVADRVMMDETVGRSLDSALSENLSELVTQIEGRIQQSADGLELGLMVVDLTLMGLHPPVSVAKDYQAVVGARIDRNTRVLEAQAYTNEVLPGAQSQANRLESRAHADAAARVALARGEAEAFSAVQKTYAAAPELFTFRRLLEAREAQLQGRSFVVIDQRFERDGGALWINGSNAANSTPLEDL